MHVLEWLVFLSRTLQSSQKKSSGQDLRNYIPCWYVLKTFFGPKVTTSVLRELSYQLYISYRVIYTKVSGVCFQQTFIPGVRKWLWYLQWVINFVCILPCCTKVIGVSFLIIFILSVKKLPRYLYMSYQLLCVCIIMLFTHELLGCIFNNIFPCYPLMLFTREVNTGKKTLVCFQQKFSRQSYRGVLSKLSGPRAYIIMLFTQKIIKVCFQ